MSDCWKSMPAFRPLESTCGDFGFPNYSSELWPQPIKRGNCGLTVKCLDREIGSSFVIGDINYLVVNRSLLKEGASQNVSSLSTMCVSHITNLSEIFMINETYTIPIDNTADLSSWDVS